MSNAIRMIRDEVIVTDLVSTFTDGTKFGYLIRIEGAGLVRFTDCTYDTEESAFEAGKADHESLDTVEKIQAAMGSLTVMDGGHPNYARRG